MEGSNGSLKRDTWSPGPGGSSCAAILDLEHLRFFLRSYRAWTIHEIARLCNSEKIIRCLRKSDCIISLEKCVGYVHCRSKLLVIFDFKKKIFSRLRFVIFSKNVSSRKLSNLIYLIFYILCISINSCNSILKQSLIEMYEWKITRIKNYLYLYNWII